MTVCVAVCVTVYVAVRVTVSKQAQKLKLAEKVADSYKPKPEGNACTHTAREIEQASVTAGSDRVI